jgi:multidrug efflux pump subunit AcrB
MRNISSWAIRNPVIPLVLFAALAPARLVSFMRMDVNLQPDIDFPIAQVRISQPGAAPSELENQVTQRVEGAARSISGVDEISSTITEGNSITMVQFKLGHPDRPRHERLRDAVARIRGELPEGILEPSGHRSTYGGGRSAISPRTRPT